MQMLIIGEGGLALSCVLSRLHQLPLGAGIHLAGTREGKPRDSLLFFDGKKALAERPLDGLIKQYYNVHSQARQLQALAQTGKLQLIILDLPGKEGDPAGLGQSWPVLIASLLYAQHQDGLPLSPVLFLGQKNLSPQQLEDQLHLAAVQTFQDAHFTRHLEECPRVLPAFCDAGKRPGLFRSSQVGEIKPQPALCVEVASELFIQAEQGDSDMSLLASPGFSLIIGPHAAQAFGQKQAVFAAAQLYAELLRAALRLPSQAAVMQDADARTLLAGLLTGEALPPVHAQRVDSLDAVMSAFKRLEGSYFTLPAIYMDPWVLLAAWQRLAQPRLLEAYQTAQGAPRLALMLALLFFYLIQSPYRKENNQPAPWEGLSADMDPDSLSYAILSDTTLWQEDLRLLPGLEAQLAKAILDLQVKGSRTSIQAQQSA